MREQRIAWLFPGQGAQYVGMGKSFFENYAEARHTFEQADDLLQRSLSKLLLQGAEEELTQTRNSQPAIFVVSMAICRVLQKLFPELLPYATAGLSLGEYMALAAGKRLDFAEALRLVQWRSEYMNQACEESMGTMAVVMGLEAPQVEELVAELRLPNDLWVANLNCPGQVVISGTVKGVEAGSEAAKAKGAKRVLPLQVHGAFHSGLMLSAEKKLTPYLTSAALSPSAIKLIMNVPGGFVDAEPLIKQHLIAQVTHPVRWEQGVRAMEQESITLYMEIGPGKTLAGMNRKIGVSAPTVSIETADDLRKLESFLTP